MSFGDRKTIRRIGSQTKIVAKPEHPKLHDSETVIVEKRTRFDRDDFTPCNDCAQSWLKAWSKRSFNTEELKFIASMGYTVLIASGYEHEEFK